MMGVGWGLFFWAHQGEFSEGARNKKRLKEPQIVAEEPSDDAELSFERVFRQCGGEAIGLHERNIGREGERVCVNRRCRALPFASS